MALELLLARADDGQPVLRQGLAVEALSGGASSESGAMPEWLWDASGDPNLLPRQRWGLVVPEGEVGKRLLALVEPLRQLRQRQQGGKPVPVYTVPPELDGLRAARWKEMVFRKAEVSEADRPRYLLLLGDLDQVSLELQQVLSSDAFVGRLAFSTVKGEIHDAGYEAYVTKVLEWEGARGREARARMLFYTSRDKTPPTELGRRGLIEPSVRYCRERHRMGGLPVTEIVDLMGEGEAAAEQLLARAVEPGPSVLLSMSHGLGAPQGGWASEADKRERQGALVLPQERFLTAAELASRPFLPGGIWFYFACFGAGTPARSSYEHWLRQLPRTDPSAAALLDSALPQKGTRPFIAALPQAVLANPEGPLGVMGHVDLAWSYSFSDHGRDTSSRFHGVLEALAEGRRAGVALGALMRFVNETSFSLTTLYNQEQLARQGAQVAPIDPVSRLYQWILRQDLAGYILLGDPAVRLPLTGPEATVAPPGLAMDALAAAGLGGWGFSGPPVAGKDPLAAEAAVIALLSQRLPLEDIAAQHGVSADELRQWEERYRAAGREALARYLSSK